MVAGEEPAATLRTDVKVGDHVWFFDRRNGRITENIARVHTLNADGTLAIVVNDQGSNRVHAFAPEWKSGATHGWSKSCS
jgi:hypothetical protein